MGCNNSEDDTFNENNNIIYDNNIQLNQNNEKKAEEEKRENDYNFEKDNDDKNNLDIRGSNLIDDLIIDKNNNNLQKNNIDINNDEEEEEEDEEENIIKENKNKEIDEDIMKEYESTLLKINEAINLNNKEVNLSNYINSNHGLTNNNQENSYVFLNGKRADKSWAQKQEETKNILMAKGIPETKQYLLESISQNEKRANFINKKKKREINGNDLFTQEAYYRAYKKRSKVLPFDKDLYDDEMENGISKNKIQNDIKKELLGNDMKAQIEKRAKFSRRRPLLEEDEVDYINERNQKYNKKLHRFFGKESKEIKNNMERRTAL